MGTKDPRVDAYIAKSAEWIAEAKGEATRQRRLETTLKWLAEGKSRNWKYQKC